MTLLQKDKTQAQQIIEQLQREQELKQGSYLTLEEEEKLPFRERLLRFLKKHKGKIFTWTVFAISILLGVILISTKVIPNG